LRAWLHLQRGSAFSGHPDYRPSLAGSRWSVHLCRQYGDDYQCLPGERARARTGSECCGGGAGRERGADHWRSDHRVSELALALVAAVLVERRVPDPILKLSLLQNRVFASANISFLFAMLALFAPGFLLPFYFEELRGFPAVQAGLLLTPLSLTLAVMAPLS